MMRTKSGIARVNASMSPRPPRAMVMYAISRESWGMKVRHKKRARKELTMESMPTDMGPTQSFHRSWLVLEKQYITSEPRRWGSLWRVHCEKRRRAVWEVIMQPKWTDLLWNNYGEFGLDFLSGTRPRILLLCKTKIKL